MALEIKTKTTGSFDFTKIDIMDMIPEYTVDEAMLQKDMDRILKANGSKVETDDVADGDMVTLNCVSVLPKFNKEGIIVPVGKGIFSKELENVLVGKKVGECFAAEVDGNEVSATVAKCVRTIVPELTDENVAAFGMDGISTVTDLKRMCIDKQLDKVLDDFEPLDEASAQIWNQFGNDISVEFDPEEKALADEKGEKQLIEINNRMEAMPEDEMEEYEDGFEEEFGEARSEIDMDEFIRNMFVNELKLAAYGYSLAKGTENELTEEQYEAKIAKWMVYHEDKTVDEVKALHTQMDFIIEGYSEQVCNAIDRYTLACFKNKMNPLR